MTMEEAMRSRHTVRRYTDRRLPREVLEPLEARVRRNNQEHGLAMSLVTENTEAFGPVWKLLLAKGVRNYVILAGGDRPGVDEAVGYCGADVMLYAQTLGLNSWWVGGTIELDYLPPEGPGEERRPGGGEDPGPPGPGLRRGAGGAPQVQKAGGHRRL